MLIASRFSAYILSALVMCASALCQNLQYTSFTVPGSTHTFASGVNNLGDIVGTADFLPDPRQSGFLYSGGQFQLIDCPGAAKTVVVGVNDKGIIAGWCDHDGVAQGFVLENATFRYVSYPGATLTSLSGINNAGDVVGAFQQGAQQYGFVYSNGIFKQLGKTRIAVGINATQTIAALICGANCHGIVKTKTKRGWVLSQKVVYPGAHSTGLAGINDNSDLVGGWGPAPDGQPAGFVYIKSSNSYRPFHIPNSSVLEAQGINNSGLIVGWYGGADNKTYSFYGTLPN
jgi:probable HAF family extracellular repeat protein